MAEAGVKDAEGSAELAQVWANKASNMLHLKGVPRAQAEAILQLFDIGVRYSSGVGGGGVSTEGSSGERKRCRCDYYNGGDGLSLAGKSNESTSEDDSGKEEGGRLCCRRTWKLLADAEATWAIARGVETKRAFRFLIEPQKCRDVVDEGKRTSCLACPHVRDRGFGAR